MTPLLFREIAHGSPEYALEPALRDEVLRQPLGLRPGMWRRMTGSFTSTYSMPTAL